MSVYSKYELRRFKNVSTFNIIAAAHEDSGEAIPDTSVIAKLVRVEATVFIVQTDSILNMLHIVEPVNVEAEK